MKTNKRKQARGFTLIELVVVVAVIAILAALLVPTILGQAERARLSRARSDVNELTKALARIRNDTGVVSNPDAATDDSCLVHADLAAASAQAILASNVGPAGCSPDGTALPHCNNAETGVGGMQIGDLCWNGPYVTTQMRTDPWNMPYISTYNVGPRTVRVQSFGPNRADDGCAAGTDDICVIQ